MKQVEKLQGQRLKELDGILEILSFVLQREDVADLLSRNKHDGGKQRQSAKTPYKTTTHSSEVCDCVAYRVSRMSD
jgi:hypothetical protein